MKKIDFCAMLIALTVQPAFAATPTPKQVLNQFGRDLRQGADVIAYVGVTARGEVCKIQISEDSLGFFRTIDGKVDADEVFGAYLGNQFSQRDARVDVDSSVRNPAGGATREVAISSSVDKSSVDLSITEDFNGFVTGTFKVERPGMYNEVCTLKAVSTHVL